jgi:hypothetical protein
MSEIKQNLEQEMESKFNQVNPIKNVVKKEVIDVEPVTEETIDESMVEHDIEYEEPAPKVVKTIPAKKPVVDEEESLPEIPVKKEMTANDILSSMKIDLNSIEISTGSDFEITMMKDQIFNNKSVTQVVCCQSGYTAHMSALKNQEIQNISDFDADLYNYKKRLYKNIHKHVEETSVGKLGFEEWMKMTSFFDLETLLFGLFNQTFPYENKFKFKCNKENCGKETDVVVNNNTLVETRGKDEEIYSKLLEILKSGNPKDMIKHSLVHTTKRIIVDETKIIFDIKIPSVYDYLEEILKGLRQDIVEEYASTFGTILFVEKMYVPNLAAIKQTGKPVYFEIKDKNQLVMNVAKLPYYDGIQLTEGINEFTEKYKITYSIKNARCGACNDVLDTINLEMEEVLFTAIRQGRQKR